MGKRARRMSVRVGAFGDDVKRKATNITSDDIPVIARMFHVENASVKEISKAVDGTEEEVRKIITGYNFTKDWGPAVTDLIAQGHKLTRSIKGVVRRRSDGTSAGEPDKMHRLAPHLVRKAREMHMTGHTLDEIEKFLGCKRNTARNIVNNGTYQYNEYIPKGWRGWRG